MITAATLAFLLPALLYLGVLVTGYDGGPYLRGDCQYYYYTAVSLWQDGDLDLANQLPPPIVRHSADVSLDIRGRLVPKHPMWLALCAQPLIITLGAPGALLFNVLQLLVLLPLTFVLVSRFASSTAAAIAVAATGMASFMPHFVWNFSPDVFICVFLIAALVVLTAGPDQTPAFALVGGLLMGMAVLAKLTAVLAIVGVPLLVDKPRVRRLILFGVGLAIPMTVGALLNLHLFGSPFITSYDRIAVIQTDSISLHSHRTDFDLPLSVGVVGQLVDHKNGLLFTSPITLLSLFGLPILFHRHRRIALYVAGTSLAIFLFYSRYQLWNSSHYGNRFLFPVVVLAAVPLAAAIDQVYGAWRDRRSASRD